MSPISTQKKMTQQDSQYLGSGPMLPPQRASLGLGFSPSSFLGINSQNVLTRIFKSGELGHLIPSPLFSLPITDVSKIVFSPSHDEMVLPSQTPTGSPALKVLACSVAQVMSDSLWPYGPWDSPGKNTGAGCHFLLQGNFLTQRSNPRLRH